MSTGVITGVIICVKGVIRQELTVGKFTLLLQLLRQLFAPLNYLGSYYRMIQNYATDMENMYDLLDSSPSITDAPNAQPLQVCTGAVEFENVSFSYGTVRDVLNNVSFGIHGGGTLGIVGSTGSGKSSLLRLLFRLYDTSHGCIKIDGQRIDKVTLVRNKDLNDHHLHLKYTPVPFSTQLHEYRLASMCPSIMQVSYKCGRHLLSFIHDSWFPFSTP